jgi:putative spermidine/putrescine transport system permease protein
MTRMSRWALLGLWSVFLVLPVLATLLYSLATVWRGRAFPDGYTLAWWVQAFSEPRVVSALMRSVWLAVLTVVVVAAVVLPALYWGHIRNGRIRTVMQLCALLPFALPFVVLAYGIKRLAGASELTQPWESSPVLVVLGHVALSFPFFLWPVDGAMSAAGVRQLSIARVITGSSFETLPVWQVSALQDTRGNPNGVAVMAIFTFLLMFIVSVLIARTGKGQPLRLLPGIGNTR